jgi:hypothetical protein
MEMSPSAEHPWRVRVNGRDRGAGVLLDQRHVLTCAHVIGETPGTAEIRSTVGRPEWKIPAQVVPGSWVHSGKDTRRGDVALLELAEPAPSSTHARLWRAPFS